MEPSRGPRFAILASRIFDGFVLGGPGAVLVEDGKIKGIGLPADVPSDLPRAELPEGATLAPGFIDLQVNGGGGVLLNDAPTVDSMRAIAAAHRRFGVTGLLPTFITDAPAGLRALVAAAPAAVAEIPGVLGVHCEGPFINTARKGVHREDFIRTPGEGDIEALLSLGRAGRSMVTLAPESVPAGFVASLARAGIRVSAGHSDASAAQVLAAADEGLTGVTHLFNAMSQMQGRAPGVVGAAMADKRLFVGVIADGLHVDPVALRTAYAACGAERLMLVSDAMSSVGAEADRFVLMGREVRLQDGRLTTAEGTLAGAHLAMDQAVRNAVSLMAVPIEHALAMAARIPATFLGLGHELGRIAPGYTASLVALDQNLDVIGTWIAGQPDFRPGDPSA
ncbi:N-acetylglucosamine-6-phosphate deacetylase [Alsobacter soli]|uniref:N-acetylglucosamine-6-phosphate deacetylase n=1 Tax=Alsobacter soli TaxID=2109933 RepID=A0A2T1HWZ8_9HYPH|nr:N-acetylglucosamine-6-phosphate deacetylase [Alsobacter soli]PSC06144.1 N-acetylglucosamine-6-phosphate deacetylase [Alsobacter soli]